MSRRMRAWWVATCVVLLAGLFGTFAACDGRGGRNVGVECTDSGDCNIDEGELIACVDGNCRAVDCLSSTDCALGSFCDSEDDFACVTGCRQDNDCLAGYSCDGNDCRRDACRSTVLDCDFLEVCDQDSGECERVDDDTCARCDLRGNQFDNNSTVTDFCDDTFLGHEDCGSNWLCAGGQPGDSTGHCLPPCESNDDCPHGFQCVPLAFDSIPPTCGKNPVLTNPVCLSDQCASQ
jgi:hypothetical protein